MIWLVFAAVTAGVILALTRPLMRGDDPTPGEASAIEAYKLQLTELAREEERGTIDKEEAEQTRNEISRRLLKASRQSRLAFYSGKPSPISANIAFFSMVPVIAIGAAGLYVAFGSRGLPDQPLEARLNAPPDRQPLAIQIANVERRLRANPNDAAGWSIIAPVYFGTGQFDKAAAAFRKAMELTGEDENKLLGLFESLVFANDGVVPAGAKPVLDAALSRNPQSVRGRLWLAVLAGQEGRKADAGQIYRQMLSENLPDGLKGAIYSQLAKLSAEPAGTAAAEGPQASADEPQAEQGAMIRGMVERLAARLKDNAQDLDGWLKLIRSYAVLKEPARAQDAAASARAQFASEPKALEQIETLVRGLGLAPSDEKGGQPKS